MNKFNFYMPLQKDVTIAGTNYLSGIASTIDIDRDKERMSEKALFKMQNDIKSIGVNLFSNHKHDWEETLGVIEDAEVINKQLKIKVKLDDPETNPKIKSLLKKLELGIKLGLSVGGSVLATKNEYDKSIGQKVNVIDDVELYEVSVVGTPANKYTNLSIAGQIAKSLNKSETWDIEAIIKKIMGNASTMDSVEQALNLSSNWKISDLRSKLESMDDNEIDRFLRYSGIIREYKCPNCFTLHKETNCPICFSKKELK